MNSHNPLYIFFIKFYKLQFLQTYLKIEMVIDDKTLFLKQ